MNPHAGRLHEVWKHLVLAEVVRAERPARFAATHAGPAVVPIPDDAERRHGIRHAAATFPRPSAYLDVARRYLADSACPGSAAVALAITPEADVLLADPDPEATADLRTWTARAGTPHTRVVTAEGVPAVAAWLARGEPALVLVDPLDAEEPADDDGTTALDLVAGLAEAGHGVVFWYGYDVPDDRGWALPTLDLPHLWAGDLLVTTADGATADDGDLALGTTPGVGCGVVLAGVDPAVARRCEQLGEALLAAYEGAPLPDGTPGALDLLVDVS